jgi:drug/metabolite transporter (DMT)-like permease
MTRSRIALWFLLVLASMLAVTGWASSQVALWATPRAVATHPWFIATLFDCYFGFIAFWLWLAWREIRWFPRIAWLVAILLLGNIAMAVYVLLALRNVPAGSDAAAALFRRKVQP